MKTKRILALFLAVVTCLSLAVSASAASISDFKDVDTKAWYAEAVTAAVDNGLLYGKSRTQLDPNGLLTRAEMAAITNRSFGCYKAADISAYKDVAKSKWYYKDVALAVQMGTYNGVSSTSMQPDRAITRQEAIAVVARALQLNLDDYTKTDLSKFADAKDVSTWALPYMKAMVAAGYVHGRTQGLAPQANITRAEFAQLYFNIIQSYITKSGSYTKDYKGNLLVRTKDVELKDMTIDGDLIIGNGVADGKVTLSNVKISGRLVVWGGGTAAVYCNDGTTAAEVIACRVDGPVKVIFDRESTLLVYDKIKTRITERAGKFPETEIVFYAMDDLLNAQRDLNKMVDENLIQAEIPAHLYAIVGEQTVSAVLKNNSKTDTYEAVIGTHVDKGHIHSHIVFNSVNADTGIKYHSTLQNYYQQIRGISDRLCTENGLSVILQGERTKTVSYIEWLRQSKGQPTFRSMLEADLRDAIADANDLGHFFLLMEHKGYEIHHGNRLGFRLRGQERFMYPERKNAAYSEENIERAIAGNLAEIEAGSRPAFIPRPKPQPYRPHPKYKGFLALYYHYCYLLGRIEKRQYPPRMTPHLRKEIMKAETYKARLKFLQENSISTADDLTACMHQAESTVTQLAKQRTILNVRKKKRRKLFDALAAEEALAMSKDLYEEGLSGMESEYVQYVEAKATLDTCGISRQALTEEKADIYEQLAQLNKQIRAERKKIKLCREIADSAAKMQQDIAVQEKFQQEKEASQTRDYK